MGRRDTDHETGQRKAALRVRLLEARRLLSESDRIRKSRSIWQRCRLLTCFQDPSLVCSYVGWGEEVRTAEALRSLLKEGVRVAVPVQGAGSSGPAFSEVGAWEDLSPNSLGILEPSRERRRILPTGEIPLFVVPGLGFDETGARLGYGLGFYDRALADSSPRALRVGLAFDFQVVTEVPVDDHDHPVDLIVTEHRVIEASIRARSQEEVC